MRLKQKKNKKQRRTEHPDDANRLIMDAIYNSPKSTAPDAPTDSIQLQGVSHAPNIA